MTRDYPWFWTFHMPGQKTNLFLFGLSHVETCPFCVFVKWVYGMSREGTSQAAVLWAWLPSEGLVGSDWISKLWPGQITALMGFSMMALLGGGDTWEVAKHERCSLAGGCSMPSTSFSASFLPRDEQPLTPLSTLMVGSLPHLRLEGWSRGQTETSENTSSTELHRGSPHWKWVNSSPCHSDAKQTQWCKKSKSYHRKNGQGV